MTTQNEYVEPAAAKASTSQAPMSQPQVVLTPKSPGVAVLLTFIWQGGGLLYAGSIALGLLFMGWNALLVLLSLTGIGAIISIPLWLVSAPVAMFLAVRSVNAYNRRNGIAVR